MHNQAASLIKLKDSNVIRPNWCTSNARNRILHVEIMKRFLNKDNLRNPASAAPETPEIPLSAEQSVIPPISVVTGNEWRIHIITRDR